jgi:hypothetical protein
MVTPLAAGVRALAWLLAEALSVGLAAGLVGLGPAARARFVTANALPAEARSLLLGVALCFCGGALLAGGLAWKRRGATALLGVSRRLAPTLLAVLVPPLLDWRAWEGRDLHFLVLAGTLVVGIRGLGRVARSAPPLGAAPWLRASAGRVGAALRRLPAAARRPVLVVALAALGYALYFGHHTIVHHRNGSRTASTWASENALWNIVHGAF